MRNKVNNWLESLFAPISFVWQNLVVIPVAGLGLVLLLAHPSLFDRLYVYRVGVVVCSVFLLLGVYLSRRVDRPRLLIYAILPLFLSINISLIYNGLATYDSLWGLYAQYLWVFMGWWLSKNISSLKVLGISFVLGVGCISGYGFLQTLDLDPFPAVTVFGSRRVISTFENPNYLGNILACSLPLLVYYFIIARREVFRWMMGITLIMTYGVWILAGSRGAWIGGVVGLLALAVILATLRVDRKFEKRASLMSYLVLGCVVVGVSIYASEKIVIANAQGKLSAYQRLLSIRHVFDPRELGDFSGDVGAASLQIGDTFVHDTTINHRYFIWDVTRKMVTDSPIVGVGYGGFAQNFSNYRADFRQDDRNNSLSDWQKMEETQYPHNEFLHILAECGTLGLLSFFWLCGFVTYHFIRARKEAPLICGTLFSGLLITLVHGQVSYPLQTPVGSLFFWLTLGILVGLLKTDLQKRF
ncbi:MAG: O-antigen ligase family protein [Candidatus Latescibacterota bacterium]|nr:O-antigen ligase family protein [Candidatus Latescibacterota bacterium]